MTRTLEKTSRAQSADRLRSIEQKIDEILMGTRQDRKAKFERDTAFQKFQTTGENAIPMRTREVAIVLGLKHPRSVFEMKNLKQRWNGGLFHPDDVRAALQEKSA